MMYEVIGGPWSGFHVTWQMAKVLRRWADYRAPTLGECYAWGWPSVIVWDG